MRVLTGSTEFLLRLIGAKKSEEPPVTEEDVAAMIDVGTAAGIFEEAEHDLVDPTRSSTEPTAELPYRLEDTAGGIRQARWTSELWRDR